MHERMQQKFTTSTAKCRLITCNMLSRIKSKTCMENRFCVVQIGFNPKFQLNSVKGHHIARDLCAPLLT